MQHIAREGEQEFAAIKRTRSGFDAGCIDYGLRVQMVENLAPAECPTSSIQTWTSAASMKAIGRLGIASFWPRWTRSGNWPSSILNGHPARNGAPAPSRGQATPDDGPERPYPSTGPQAQGDDEMTTPETNIQVWQGACDDHQWIVSREDGECSKTLSAHNTREEALAAAKKHLAKGHELIECHDCGIWVEPQADSHGVGSHCPHCSATL